MDIDANNVGNRYKEELTAFHRSNVFGRDSKIPHQVNSNNAIREFFICNLGIIAAYYL
jgi:hypothetical protein